MLIILNSQNINCKSISLYLNKEKYQVKSLVLGSKNIPKLDGVSYFRVSSFLFFFKFNLKIYKICVSA